MCIFNVHVRCSETQRKNSKTQNVSQPFVCHSCITENFSFPFADCTDSEFAEITDVNIDDDYKKSFKIDTLNASKLNFIYSNKIHIVILNQYSIMTLIKKIIFGANRQVVSNIYLRRMLILSYVIKNILIIISLHCA